MASRRRVLTTRVTAAAVALMLVAAACTTPSAPAPEPDGGPIPSGTTYKSWSLTPEDAPTVLEEFRAAANDPTYAEKLAPAIRDTTMAQIEQLVAAPDALDRIRAAIVAENDASARRNATGRLPGPPTDAQLVAEGVPTDRLPAFHGTPTPAPTPTTVPPDVAPRGQSQIVGGSVPPVTLPDGVVATSVTPTGATWPPASQYGWAVAGGTKADAFGSYRERLVDPVGNPPSTASPRACGLGNTGTRHLPDTPVPAFTSRLFTPLQNTFASTDSPTGATPGTVVTYSGDLQTRMDPDGTGIRQFKVEAHLISPFQYKDLFNNPVDARPDDFQGHILVSRFGSSQKLSYFPGSPHTEWHTFCYAEDLGQTDVQRAYVEAWVPLDQTTPGAGPSVGDVAEPGFQVRFETVDNCWRPWLNCQPAYFYGGDQSTVVLQRGNGPLAYDRPVPGGSLSARVSDRVMVDRDQDPTNDIESILKSQILPQVKPALESIDGFQFSIPLITLIKVTSAEINQNDIGLDIDLRPIGNDDEYEFTASAGFNTLELGGYYFLSASFCPFTGDLSANVSVKGRVNLKNGDTSKLDVNVTSTVANVGISNFWSYNFLSLSCLISGLTLNDLAAGIATTEANDHVAPTVDSQLTDPVKLDVDQVTKPGAGGAFDTALASFERSCPPRGCDGGDVLLDKDGLAIMASLNVKDAKAPNDPRRFPLVFNPTLERRLTDQYVPDPLTGPLTNPDGRPYAAAVAIHPTTVNQVLRAITEGTGGANQGALNASGPGFELSAPVAPIMVNDIVLPDQPALTVLAPDLRLRTNLGGDTDNLFSLNFAIGLDLKVDSATRRLVTSVRPWPEINTLRCDYYPRPGAFQYDLCVDTKWEGGKELGLSFSGVLDTIRDTIVPAAMSSSFGEIHIPKVAGSFDVTSLGDSEIRNVNGFLTLFVGMPVIPGIDVSATTEPSRNELSVTALAKGLPGTGPITYDIELEDLNGSHTFHPPPGTADTVTDTLSSYVKFSTPYLLVPRRVRVTVTASRNSSTLTTVKDLVVT